MPSEWREVLARRNRTSKTKRLYEDDQPTNKYSWDGMVGTSLHYEESGAWLEVDPRIVPTDEPGWDWEMRKSQWRFLGRNEGWFAAEKQDVGIGFKLGWVAYLNTKTKEWQTIRTANYTTPTVEAIEHGNDLLANPLGRLTWHDLFPNAGFEIHVSGDKLHQEVHVSQAARDGMPAPPYPTADTYLVMVYQVDWGQVPGLADDDGDINYKENFERQGRLYLKNHQGEIITVLPASRAWAEQDEEAEVPLRKRFVKIGEQHYLLVGAPVLALNALPEGTVVFDPDIDVTVGASSDDAKEATDGDTALTDTYLFLSSGLRWFGARWTGVDVPSGAAVSVAHVSVYIGTNDDARVDCYFENGSNPGTFVSGASNYNISGRTRTTNHVDWDADGVGPDGFRDSPSLVTPLQEVVDDNSGTADALVAIWEGMAADKFLKIYTWDYDNHSRAPKLHIEYTVGNGDVTLDAVLATATAAGLVPIATAGTGATISGELAAAGAEGLVPVVSGGTGATVTAILAEAAAAALLPTITGGALVSGELAEAIAEALVATITGGIGATVSTELAEAVAAALVPTVTGGATVSAELAAALAEALIPVISGEGIIDATVYATIADAIAMGLVPIVTRGTGTTVSAAVATALAEALVPQILAVFMRLTLRSRSVDLDLDSRNLDLTLATRILNMTLGRRNE